MHLSLLTHDILNCYLLTHSRIQAILGLQLTHFLPLLLKVRVDGALELKHRVAVVAIMPRSDSKFLYSSHIALLRELMPAEDYLFALLWQIRHQGLLVHY